MLNSERDILTTAVAISHNLDSNCRILEQELCDVRNWCLLNGVKLDYAKTGLIHFTRKRISYNPPISLPREAVPLQITHATGLGDSLRWLGVHFDRKLTFRQHMQIIAHKAMRAATALRMLGGCSHGAPAAFLRLALCGGVLPTLTYAAEVWWPIHSHPRRGAKNFTKQVDKAINVVLRSILPVYRTTLNPLLHHAAGIPPADITYKTACRRAAARIARLDPLHPLRTQQTPTHLKGRTRLSIIQLLPAPPDFANCLARPVWHQPLLQAPSPATGPNKKSQTLTFLRWQHLQSPRDLWLYTDESRLEDGRTGAGWVLYLANKRIASKQIPCGLFRGAFDAEAIAPEDGLRHTLAQPFVAAANNLWVCLDSQAVIRCTHGQIPPPSSQAQIQVAASSLLR